MKVTIEKQLETLEDLRLAKEHLRKKAKLHEAKLINKAEGLYNDVSAKRIYEETLDGFDLNGLMLQLLPYALKYKDELLTNPVVKQLSRIKKKHVPYVAGAAAILGAMAYSYFSKDETE